MRAFVFLAFLTLAVGCAPAVGGGVSPPRPDERPAATTCADDADCDGDEGCLHCVDGACAPDPACCRGDLDCDGSFRCLRAYGRIWGRCADDRDAGTQLE